MTLKRGRARVLSFWNMVFLFTIGASLLLMATMLFAPGLALAQQALPVSIQSPLLANYSADEVTGDKELLHQAIALDPLTGAQLTLPRIRQMVDEMFEAEKKWLPQF